MDPFNARRLKIAIDAILDASSDLPDGELAAILAEREAELIAAETPGWVIEKLAGMFRLQRNRRNAADPDQTAFPFYDLHIPLPLKDKPVELRLATIGILKQSVKFLSAKKKTAIDNPRRNSFLGKLEREIELMQPYVYDNRKITVEEVHELIARGTPPPSRKDGRMSDAMRRYWESKTPEERSAIAKRRETTKKRKRA